MRIFALIFADSEQSRPNIIHKLLRMLIWTDDESVALLVIWRANRLLADPDKLCLKHFLPILPCQCGSNTPMFLRHIICNFVLTLTDKPKRD